MQTVGTQENRMGFESAFPFQVLCHEGSSRSTMDFNFFLGKPNKNMDVSENSGFYPQIIHFNRVFHEKNHPFWRFSPYFWFNTHIQKSPRNLLQMEVLVFRLGGRWWWWWPWAQRLSWRCRAWARARGGEWSGGPEGNGGVWGNLVIFFMLEKVDN